MRSVSTALMRANCACDYVQNTVRFRFVNQREGINKTPDQQDYIEDQLDDIRQETTKYCYDFSIENQATKSINNKPTNMQVVDFLAKKSFENRCGCCEEAVALAFMYLTFRGESGIATMKIIGIDHVFIVMGFAKPPPPISYTMLNFGPPIEWGKNTVVCDPWYNECFLSDVDWMRKIRQIVRYATRKIDETTGEVTELDMKNNTDLWLKVNYEHFNFTQS